MWRLAHFTKLFDPFEAACEDADRRATAFRDEGHRHRNTLARVHQLLQFLRTAHESINKQATANMILQRKLLECQDVLRLLFDDVSSEDNSPTGDDPRPHPDTHAYWDVQPEAQAKSSQAERPWHPTQWVMQRNDDRSDASYSSHDARHREKLTAHRLLQRKQNTRQSQNHPQQHQMPLSQEQKALCSSVSLIPIMNVLIRTRMNRIQMA